MMTDISDDDDYTIVKLRGLPWEATEENVIEFFTGLQIQEDGIFIEKTSVGRASGEGYVQFVDNDNAQEAMKKNREKIDHRYIEIFKSTEEERNKAINVPVVVYDISNSKISESSTVIRMRGLPWSTTEKDVRDFFAPTEVSDIHIIPDHMGRASGEGYVEFSTPEAGEEAMLKQKENMGDRYIELFKSSPDELSCILVRLNPPITENSFLIRMRGLPYSASEDQINDFFGNPDALIKVHFIQDINGRATGEAFAEFSTEEATEEAMKKDKESVGDRYIELFKATPDELKATLRRPPNYGRRRWKGPNSSRQNRASKPNMSKEELDHEMDTYQKKRKVHSPE